jgi:hypothetical protein
MAWRYSGCCSIGRAEVRQHHAIPLTQGLDVLARHGEIVLGRLEFGARADALDLELLLALELQGEVADALLLGGDLPLALAIMGAEPVDALAHAGELGLGGGERDPVGLGIDFEEKLAGLDDLVVGDENADDTPIDDRADVDDVGLHIGVLGGDVAPAVDVHPCRAAKHEERHGAENHGAKGMSSKRPQKPDHLTPLACPGPWGPSPKGKPHSSILHKYG